MKRFAFLALLAAAPVLAQVTLTQSPASIKIDINGSPFTELFIGPETGKPYLHPLRSASGKIVTRLYPMEKVEGERHDHPHHQGLWFTHGDVNGIDFWSATSDRSGEKFGRVVLVGKPKTSNGEKTGSLSARFNWVNSSGKTLLTEDRAITFHAHPALRIIDFDVRFTGVEKARFGDTKEGTFAIRVAESMNETRGGTLINAEGMSGEKNVWGKRSPWMDYSGEVQGEKLGIALFDHPENPKHPTYWHVRAYGLFAANIFGERDFYNDKARDGAMTLAPGESWRFRYRVIIHPGDAATAGLAGLYKQYAGR